jgi:hypothetical protein
MTLKTPFRLHGYFKYRTVSALDPRKTFLYMVSPGYAVLTIVPH